MSRFRKIVDDQSAHIRTLRALVCGLFGVTLILAWGWYSAPKELVVHVPPDLRSGSTRKLSEIPSQSVYAFAFYLFQQLNRWAVNGEEDYGNRIHNFSAYLTPEFAETLSADFTTKQAQRELQNRQRALYEVPGRVYAPSRVKIESPDSWVVYLDLQVIETYRGETVKNTAVRYPLRVVRYDVDPEQNPFGLALAGFESPPERLVISEDALEEGGPR
jgi:integrating conjugative element protein (TIGR03746 family)